MQDKIINIKQIVLFVFFLLLNCIACQSITIGYVTAFVETFLVILFLIQGKIDSAIIANNLFLGFSIEVSAFVYGEYRTMYSYAFMPYVHRFGPLLIEVVILLMMLLKSGFVVKIGEGASRVSWRRKFVCQFSIIILIGFVVALFANLINDNNITSLNWYGASFISESTYWITLLTNILCIHLEMNSNACFANKLRISLISFFLAMVIASWISVILGFHGTYSFHTNVLLMPLASFYCVLLLFFLAFKQYKMNIMLILGIAMFVCQVIMTTPLLGKWVLLIVISVVAYLWVTMTKGKFFKAIGMLLFIGIIAVVIGNTILSTNDFLSYKFNQAMSIFQFGTGSMLRNMSGSPLVRVEEFANTVVEYINKPWFALLGKGIGGTVQHWTNWTSWRDTSAFTANQIFSGVFMELHESVNVIFLKFGVLGLLFLVSTVITSIKNVNKSPWIFMGLMWFLLFINSYISLYIMAAVFMLGMYESDHYQE